tara:strand:- start:221 stop:430 length:210 start_codon:yes stop_codon:yes gene_type:complete
MKKENRILLKTFFTAGIFFACGMALYGYLNEDNYLIWKFIIHFILFGLTMGILARKIYLKKKNEVDSND